MQEEYLGPARRKIDEKDLKVLVVGNGVAVGTMITALIALVSAIFYATVWFTKLDDRVLDNTASIAAVQALNVEHTKTLQQMQANCTKTTLILEQISRRLGVTENELRNIRNGK